MAGTSSSLPTGQKSTSLEAGDEDLPPGLPSDADSSLSRETSTDSVLGGRSLSQTSGTKSGHRWDQPSGLDGSSCCSRQCWESRSMPWPEATLHLCPLHVQAGHAELAKAARA